MRRVDGAALTAAYATLKSGSLWSSTGKCKGYAVSNPGEAAKIDAYVAAVAAGQFPVAPVLQTATGRGIVGMLAALAPSPPPLRVSVQGAAKVGQTMRAVLA